MPRPRAATRAATAPGGALRVLLAALLLSPALAFLPAPVHADAVGLVARMPFEAYAADAVWTGTEILLFGGSHGAAPGNTRVWRVDPATHAFTDTGRSTQVQADSVVVWTGAVAYVMGGEGTVATGNWDADRIWRYDPATNALDLLPVRLPGGRERAHGFWDARATPACPAGCAYLLGGEFYNSTTRAWTFHDTIVRFDPASTSVTVLPERLPGFRSSGAYAFDGASFWILGGVGPGFAPLDEVLRYDPATGSIEVIDGVLPPNHLAGAAIWDGDEVVVFGGRSWVPPDNGIRYLDTVVVWDPVARVATTLPERLPSPRFDVAAVFDGVSTHLFGGYSASAYTDEVLRFDRHLPTPPTTAEAARGPARGEVTVSWGLPDHDDGATAWRLYRVAPGPVAFVGAVPSGVFSAVASGLTEGVANSFEVRALSADGEGPGSPVASAFPAGLPGAPRALAASPGPGRGQVSLAWLAPLDDGGSPVQGYRVFRDGAFQGAATGRSFTATGLPDDATFAWSVSAESALGEGPRSVPVAGRTPRLPGAPQALRAETSPLPGEIRVAWAPPADHGGAPVSSYAVYRRAESGGPETLLATTAATSYADGGHAHGVRYVYRVAAVNAVGEGPRTAGATASAVWLLDLKVQQDPFVLYRDADDDNVVDPGEAVVGR